MKKKTDKKIYFYIISALLIIVIFTMSIGFASYNKVLPLNGTVTVNAPGNVEITNITRLESNNIISEMVPTYSLLTANFDITFPASTEASITYQIELTNNSNVDYIYNGITINYSSSEDKISSTISGIENGTTISAGSSVTFNLTFTSSGLDNETEITIEAIIQGTTNTEGTFLASITPSTGDLKSPNTMSHFTISVINTYSYDRSFTLSLSNNNLKLTDSNGNELDSLTIGANTEANFDFYIMAVEDATFLESPTTTEVLVHTSGVATFNAGTLLVEVDINDNTDTEPPILKNATLTLNNTKGSITADWSYSDTSGSTIESYTILLYNEDNTLVKEVTSTSNTYTFTDIEEGNYYFIVYGVDAAGNSGESYKDEATTDEGYATKSNTLNAKWTYTVTTNLTNLSFDGESTATLNESYTATLSTATSQAFNQYYLPESIQITMNGETLTSGTDYTYSSQTGEITIVSVTGDIVITASATSGCLAEGTKILLASGEWKNIENITYDDLLLVYNYETGTMTKEYPVWIEKKGISQDYTLSTFSDGSTLKTIGTHGLYSFDDNKFVDTTNKEEYHIGTKVAKYSNGKITEVTVTNIEYYEEEIAYYQVISSIYYNIVANNLITTDGNINLVNMYNFNNNFTWQINRSSLISDSKNTFTYDELSDIMPKYMFIGLRANEMKWLVNSAEIPALKNSLISINEELLVLYPKINNTRYFTVSTSTGETVKIKEGDTYTLPNINSKIIGWYNTIDNKIYLPSSKVKIELSTHFEAIYKK